MLPNPVSSNRPVKEKIAWTESCFKESGELFLKDEKIATLLSEFKSASKASRQQMDASGVVALCRECDQEEGGSCCGKGLEDRYDAWLLLINRLLGVKFPRERQQADGCFFLGEKGCLLIARHVICINYVCKKITINIHPLVINDLREAEGEEISALFMLNEQVKRTFRKWMDQQKRV
ncbi:MAG: hypothetical protein K9N10_00965 [Deltaproteobacteria bacterium]|nr:hypothetical protein [Deltaproteobacteria bacterium]